MTDQLQEEITRLARNTNLKKAAALLGLHNVLLRGEPTQGTVSTADINKKTYQRKPIPLIDSPRVVHDKKVLADTVEALIGAAFLADGLYAAAKVVKALRLDSFPITDVGSWQYNWERIGHLYRPQQAHQVHQSQDEDEGYASGVSVFAGVETDNQGN
jgi:dsRNA-specific ribonuclease